MKTVKLRAAIVACVATAAGVVIAGSLLLSAPANGQLFCGDAPCDTTTTVAVRTTTTAVSTPSGGCTAINGSVCSGDGTAINGSTSSGCSTAMDKSVSSGCAPKKVTPGAVPSPASPARAVSRAPHFAG